jgi:hypothetical protein
MEDNRIIGMMIKMPAFQAFEFGMHAHIHMFQIENDPSEAEITMVRMFGRIQIWVSDLIDVDSIFHTLERLFVGSSLKFMQDDGGVASC